MLIKTYLKNLWDAAKELLIGEFIALNFHMRKKKRFKIDEIRSSPRGAVPTRNHEVEGSIPGLAPWVKDLALPGAVL